MTHMTSNNLFQAIERGDVTAVSAAITAGADVNAICTEGENKGATPLLLAVLGNSWAHRKIIHALLDAGAKIDAVDDANAWTALHYAAQLSIGPGLISLLVRGANPNIRDKVGRIPLSYCGINGENMLLFPLMFAGSDPTIAATSDKHTPATYAAMKAGIELGDIYMTLKRGYEANRELFSFFKAIMVGDKVGFDQALDTYAKAELEYGETPLMVAAMAGRTDMIRELIEHGAHVEAANNKSKYSLGWTSMHWASIFAAPKALEILVEKGGNIDAPDSFGNTPLINGLLDYQDIETIETVLRLGAKVNIKNSYGETPLYAALRGRSVEAVRMLVDAGADLSAVTNDGGPLTHSLARTPNPEIIEYIIGKGLDIHAAGPDGWQAIHVACEAGNLPALKMFIKLGSDPQAKTKEGKTPLDIAEQGGFDEISTFLRTNKAA